LRFRLIERRRWYYHNLAHFLCQTYSQITLEDMNLSQLHQRTDNPALQNAAVYRNYAAVGELRFMLKQLASKYNCKMIEGNTKNTTLTCNQCGEVLKAGGSSLRLTCTNGHEFDQDVNASRNLLAQMDDSFGKPHIPKLQPYVPIQIPDRLKIVCVVKSL